jgi:hypothetical protein
MAFSTDEDLLLVQPAIFDVGVSSFEDLHELAAAETARAVQRLWIPRQRTVKKAEFDRYALDPAQWKMAACYRVLGWHVLPLLAGRDEATEFWLAMAETYKKAYRDELEEVIEGGVEYLVGSDVLTIQPIGRAEAARFRR